MQQAMKKRDAATQQLQLLGRVMRHLGWLRPVSQIHLMLYSAGFATHGFSRLNHTWSTRVLSGSSSKNIPTAFVPLAGMVCDLCCKVNRKSTIQGVCPKFLGR
jgi:hypothetical protein